MSHLLYRELDKLTPLPVLYLFTFYQNIFLNESPSRDRCASACPTMIYPLIFCSIGAFHVRLRHQMALLTRWVTCSMTKIIMIAVLWSIDWLCCSLELFSSGVWRGRSVLQGLYYLMFLSQSRLVNAWLESLSHKVGVRPVSSLCSRALTFVQPTVRVWPLFHKLHKCRASLFSYLLIYYLFICMWFAV